MRNLSNLLISVPIYAAVGIGIYAVPTVSVEGYLVRAILCNVTLGEGTCRKQKNRLKKKISGNRSAKAKQPEAM